MPPYLTHTKGTKSFLSLLEDGNPSFLLRTHQRSNISYPQIILLKTTTTLAPKTKQAGTSNSRSLVDANKVMKAAGGRPKLFASFPTGFIQTSNCEPHLYCNSRVVSCLKRAVVCTLNCLPARVVWEDEGGEWLE
jgi:hypothetical protein